MARITLAITGSIAAYKTVDLVSSLKKQGNCSYDQAATAFIQPLTLQVLSQNTSTSRCHAGTFSRLSESHSNGKETDLFIVVPATADHNR